MRQERIISARKEKKLKQIDIAEILGVSVDTVRRWEQGKRSPRAEDLARLAAALNTTVAYLSGETDDPGRASAAATPAELPLPESNVRPIPGPFVMVPVLGPESTVCCGPGADIEDVIPEPQWYEPIPESWLTGPKGDKPYYITHVEGDSMEPLIDEGERVLVNPNKDPLNGDVAVAVWRGRSMVKGVAFERNGDVRLVPMNKAYKEILVKKEDCPFDLWFNGVVIRFLGVDRVSHGWM